MICYPSLLYLSVISSSIIDIWISSISVSLIINSISGLIEFLHIILDLFVCIAESGCGVWELLMRRRIYLLLVLREPIWLSWLTFWLLLTYHDLKPLLEITLHFLTAALEKVLDPLNFLFQLFELIVLPLVILLQLGDFGLFLFLLSGLNDLSIVIDETSHCILLTNLFDFACVLFDKLSWRVNPRPQLLSSAVFIFKQQTIIFHCLIFTIAFSEHIECLCSICQIIHWALNWCRHHLLHFFYFFTQSTILLLILVGTLLI